MQDFEVSLILDNLKYTDRNLWECSRLIAYCNIQKACKEKLEPTELISFSWEDIKNTDTTTNNQKTINNEDIDRLKIKARLFEDIAKNSTIIRDRL